MMWLLNAPFLGLYLITRIPVTSLLSTRLGWPSTALINSLVKLKGLPPLSSRAAPLGPYCCPIRKPFPTLEPSTMPSSLSSVPKLPSKAIPLGGTNPLRSSWPSRSVPSLSPSLLLHHLQKGRRIQPVC